MDCELGGPVSNLIEDGFGLRSRSHLACSRGVKATTLALALTSASVSASESFHFGQTAQHNIAKLQNCETAVQTVNCIFRGRERERERAKIMRPAERFVNYALPLYYFFHCGSHLALLLLLAFLGNRKSFVAQFAL